LLDFGWISARVSHVVAMLVAPWRVRWRVLARAGALARWDIVRAIAKQGA
jgi:hypothetical protein